MTNVARSNSKWTPGPHPFGLSADDVDFTIEFPCTYSEVIQKIAEQLKLRTEGLPEDWKQRPLPDGMKFNALPGWICSHAPDGYYLIVRGSAFEKVKSLCGHFKNVECKRVGKAFRFRVMEMGGGLSAFDELAGRLTYDAPRGSNGRIVDDDYHNIVVELDKAGYKPIDCLERESRKALALWNQTHSRDGKARQTFLSAYLHSQFSSDVRRRLSRAQGEYKKAHRIA